MLTLSYYRLISLLGCLYTIVAKILVIRFNGVISCIMNEVQSTYIEGRNILDGCLVMNEIYYWAMKENNSMFL